jgi:hypothetical protein
MVFNAEATGLLAAVVVMGEYVVCSVAAQPAITSAPHTTSPAMPSELICAAQKYPAEK